jgi:hypothetical protein
MTQSRDSEQPNNRTKLPDRGAGSVSFEVELDKDYDQIMRGISSAEAAFGEFAKVTREQILRSLSVPSDVFMGLDMATAESKSLYNFGFPPSMASPRPPKDISGYPLLLRKNDTVRVVSTLGTKHYRLYDGYDKESVRLDSNEHIDACIDSGLLVPAEAPAQPPPPTTNYGGYPLPAEFASMFSRPEKSKPKAVQIPKPTKTVPKPARRAFFDEP